MRYEVQALSIEVKQVAEYDWQDRYGKGTKGTFDNKNRPMVDYCVIDNEAKHPMQKVICYATLANAKMIAEALNNKCRLTLDSVA